MEYKCEPCGFSTFIKCNWETHLERSKHKKLTEKKESPEHIILRQIREIRQLKLELVQSQILIETGIDDHAKEINEKDGVIKILMARCAKYEFSL